MGHNLCQGTCLPRHQSSHRLNHSPGTNNDDKDSSESNGLPQSSRNVPPPPPKLSDPQLPPRAKSRSMDTSQGFHCGLSQRVFFAFDILGCVNLFGRMFSLVLPVYYPENSSNDCCETLPSSSLHM